jgi:hypothetical protein
MRDDPNTWRWFDVWGLNAVRWELDMVTLAQDASANPAGYTTTEAGTNTIALQASTDQGTLLITTGGTENNGLQIQPLGEAFSFAGRYPAYFGIKFQNNDVDQSDILAGLTITDTSAIVAVSDGIYFRTVDESAVLNFVLEKDSVESTTAAATLVDATWITAEFYYDGEDTITAYIDGTEVASIARTDASFPNDEHLTPIIAILTGETAAQTLTIQWARAFQIYQ